MAIGRLEYPLPRVELRKISDNVTDTLAKVTEIEEFRDSLKYLQSRGIPVTQIARILNITRFSFYHWVNGRRVPTTESLYSILMVKEWAKELRQKEAEQQSQQFQPHVLQS
jgi:DNA-binding transcriptional regulator YiaG